MGADAMIIFNTKIDPDGFKKGIKSLDQSSDGLTKSMDRVTNAIDKAFEPKNTEQMTAAIMKQQQAVDELSRKLSDITEYNAKAPIVEDLKNQLTEAEKSAASLDAEIERLTQKLEVMGQANPVATQQKRMQTMKTDLNELINSSVSVNEKAEQIRATYANIDMPPEVVNELRQLEATSVSLDQKIDEARISLEQMGKVDAAGAHAKNMQAVEKELDDVINKSAQFGERANQLKYDLSSLTLPTQPKETAEQLSNRLAVASQRLDEMKAKSQGASQATTSGFEKTVKSLERMGNRIKNLVLGALVFEALSKAVREFRKYLMAAMSDNSAFARSFNQLKANTYAMIQPIINALIPALTGVAKLFSTITGYILQVIAMISGTSVDKLYAQAKQRDMAARKAEAKANDASATANKKAAEAQAKQVAAEAKEEARIAAELAKQDEAQKKHLEAYETKQQKAQDKYQKAIDKQQKAQDQYAEKIKKTNTELKKTTASFDDLITLSSDASNELDSISDTNTMDEIKLEEIPFEELKFDDITSNIKDAIVEGFDQGVDIGSSIFDNISPPTELTQKVKDLIAMIMAIGAILLLVIGVILLCTGNIPLGLGLVIAGALMLYAVVAPMWGQIGADMQNTIKTLMVILGGAMLLIGFILAMTGAALAVGIGLMIAGAIVLGAAVAVSWDSLSPQVKKVIEVLMAIVGVAFLAIGFILLATGNLPLGIALLALGAVALASAVALSWNSMSDKMKTVIEILLAVIGVAMLVLGCILAFTGVGTALGVALIAVGAASLAASVALAWGSMSPQMKTAVEILLAVLGAALLVIGCILAFTGVAAPLGIAIIAVGAAALASAVALAWDSLSPEMRNTITALMAILGAALLAIGCILVFTGAALPIGIALIVIGAGAIVAAAALNEDGIKGLVTRVLEVLKTIAMGALVVLGIILCVTGLIPLGIALLAYALPKFLEGLQTFGVDTSAILAVVNDVIEKLKSAFANAWEHIKHGAAMVWYGIQYGVISAVNFVIDVINTMVEGILLPFNEIINGLNSIPNVHIAPLSWSIQKVQLPPKPELPALAMGAVLPGGSPFAAIVNDQPAGQTNIEAPLATIEEALENVFLKYSNEIFGEKAYVARVEGSGSGFFRYLNIELERDRNRASAF